ATVGLDGQPAARMLLLKHADERGFVFHTNVRSRKGRELGANPRAALCFHWQPLERQVRVEGMVEPVSEAEADAYFQTRPRLRQLGAWASDQSEVIPEGDSLEQRVEAVAARFEGREVQRPPHWSGFRLRPALYEFWLNVEGRLHIRHRYTRTDRGWHVDTLFP
ncbi:MAG: pyridoxamine 5'-phosphate oxidase, partial [Gemmatimonadaceae bacterium]|nr:pyridoxamine 5'-phosphate oxidase [Gemmatimonadaceae bacterium]